MKHKVTDLEPVPVGRLGTRAVGFATPLLYKSVKHEAANLAVEDAEATKSAESASEGLNADVNVQERLE